STPDPFPYKGKGRIQQFCITHFRESNVKNMIETAIKKYDIKDMRKILIDFPRQVREAVSIGEAVICPIDGTTIKNVVISGLGGSAIGGDVLRAYTAES